MYFLYQLDRKCEYGSLAFPCKWLIPKPFSLTIHVYTCQVSRGKSPKSCCVKCRLLRCKLRLCQVSLTLRSLSKLHASYELVVGAVIARIRPRYGAAMTPRRIVSSSSPTTGKRKARSPCGGGLWSEAQDHCGIQPQDWESEDQADGDLGPVGEPPCGSVVLVVVHVILLNGPPCGGPDWSEEPANRLFHYFQGDVVRIALRLLRIPRSF